VSEPRTAREVFETYVRRVNDGDIDSVMALFAEGVSASPGIRKGFGDGSDDSRSALRNYIKSTVIDNGGKIHIIRVAVDAEWVYGLLELESQLISRIGSKRIRGIDELQVKAGKITSFRFMPDITDAQTRVFTQAVVTSGAI
jgi:predicted DNA binding protein